MKSRLNTLLFPFALTLAAALFPSLASAEDVQGVVQAVKQVSVSSPVLQEVIKQVLVSEGDTVKEGQIIVQLQNAKEELAVQEADRLVENLEFVAKGAQSLYNEKMGSQEAALKAKTELALAKIRKAAAEVNFNEKTIRAPLSGIVTKKHKEAGESVDRVEKLIDIVNIDQVYVTFHVSPRLLPELKIGQVVSVRFADPLNAKFDGKIDFIAPNIDVGLLRIKVLIDNPDHVIKAGLTGTASFGK